MLAIFALLWKGKRLTVPLFPISNSFTISLSTYGRTTVNRNKESYDMKKHKQLEVKALESIAESLKKLVELLSKPKNCQ